MWEQEASLIFPDCFPLDLEGGDRISVRVCQIYQLSVYGDYVCTQSLPVSAQVMKR